MFCIASSFVGYLLKPLGWAERLLLAAAGFAFIHQGGAAIVAGLAILAATIAWQRWSQKNAGSI